MREKKIVMRRVYERSSRLNRLASSGEFGGDWDRIDAKFRCSQSCKGMNDVVANRAHETELQV